MGIYPSVELTYDFLKSYKHVLSVELNQQLPRIIKNNLIFYKFEKIVCGPYNTALITNQGALFLHGSNEFG